MRRFERDGDDITTTLDGGEVELLDSLVGQLVDMLTESDPRGESGSEPDTDDPFELWARDLAAEPSEPETPDDPALQRLFPNAYPHDDRAAAEFRRFTQGDAWQSKLTAAQVVRDGLAATDGGRLPLRIGPSQIDPWLRCLAHLRLVFATRLGIEDADSAERIASLPDDDPRTFMNSVYEWLGFAQETLVQAL